MNLFARSENQISAMWLVSEKIRREKVGSVPTLLLVASREQIRPVENVILVIVILLPVKFLLKLSGPVIFTDYVWRHWQQRMFSRFHVCQ